ncbi:hypothetical protein PLICRDRAFT_696426 [Plicaturopsis crispa FD-325 SS-3]|nr:hypothetical protein PLICRDRAFT_696426 [Plicaturopsis crispa FD-325 SS-3]
MPTRTTTALNGRGNSERRVSALKLTQVPPTQCLPLPFELEHMIFVTAARKYRPNMLRLVLVAHRVKEWITPILYEMVSLQKAKRCNLFLRTLGERPDLGRHVKALCFVGPTGDESFVYPILSACISCVNLAMWHPIPHPNSSRLWSAIQGLCLERLSLPARYFAPSPQSLFPTTHVFGHLTHLEVFTINAIDDVAKWNFHLLPCLTHLRILVNNYDDDNDKDQIGGMLRIISKVASLRLVLFEINDMELPALSADDDFDPRLVFVVDSKDALLDWTHSVRGGRNVWTQGEKIVLKQRATGSYAPFELR